MLMHLRFYIYFVTIFCSQQVAECNYFGDDLMVNVEESSTVHEESVRKVIADSTESFFGVLHSQDAIDKWADMEAEIVEVLEKRLELIDEEIGLITEYLEDYDESTGEAMRHLREPKETPEERGKVVGSSAVLGHRMTSRYAGVISQIRRFLTSDDFLENEENLSRILEETEATGRLAPDSEDLLLSMASFFHAQHSYGYRPFQLVYGFNSSTSHNAPRLSALQCAELGIFAILSQEYQISVEWLEVAQNLLSKGEDDEEYNLQLNLVSSLIRLAIQHHNRAFHTPLKTDHETLLNFYTSPILPIGTRTPAQNS